MASPGELIDEVAAALNKARATIVTYDRFLTIAGLRTKYGRGRGAAKVTPRDAARLLIAVLGSSEAQDSAATIRRYERTRKIRTHKSGHQGSNAWTVPCPPEIERLPEDHNFIDAIEALIASISSGTFVAALDACRQAFGGAGTFTRYALQVEIKRPGTHAGFVIQGLRPGDSFSCGYALPIEQVKNEPSGIHETRWIAGDVIWRLGRLLSATKSDAPFEQARASGGN